MLHVGVRRLAYDKDMISYGAAVYYINTSRTIPLSSNETTAHVKRLPSDLN